MRARLLGEEEQINPHEVDPTYAQRKAKIMGTATQDSDSTAVDGANGPDSPDSPDSPVSPTSHSGHHGHHNHNHHQHPKAAIDEDHANQAGKKKFGDRLTIPSMHREGWRDFIRDEKQRAEASSHAPLTEVEETVQHAHQRVEGIIQRRKSRESERHLHLSDAASEREMINDEQQAQELESELVKTVMQLIIQLEAEARQMLLDSMDKGVARTLLLADRNGELAPYPRTKSHCDCGVSRADALAVQQRDVRALRGDDADMIAIWNGESDKTDKFRQEHPGASSSLDLLSQVSRWVKLLLRACIALSIS